MTDEQTTRIKHSIERQQEEKNRIANDANLSEEEKKRKTEEIEQDLEELNALAQLGDRRIPKGSHPLSEIFKRIIGRVPRQHPYFIENPPDQISLARDGLSKLESAKPFFVDFEITPDGKFHYKVNGDAVPFVWEEIGFSPRFSDAENQTNVDSGLLALCAVSSQTSEKQARLYKTMTDVILRVHKRNPQALEIWWEAQQSAQATFDGAQISSAYVFRINDFIDPIKEILRPENERLLPWKDSKTFNFKNLTVIWQTRIKELRQALSEDRLEPYHLRWIEFLSHSVNLPLLIQVIKNPY